MSSKGGSGGNTSSYSANSTVLPDWVTNASQQAVSLGQQVASTPVPVYSGDRVADVNQDTNQAYQQIRDLQGGADQAFNQAQGIYGNLSQGAQLLTPEQQNQMAQTLMGGYQQNVINPVSGLLEPYIGQGPATAQQVANNALTIMSPYSQAVIDPALKIGQQQLQQNLRTIGSAANQAGAFGGTRQGVQEGVAQSQAALGAGQYVGDLLQKGWTSALTPAQAIALQGGQQSFNATNALAGLYGTGYQGAQGAAQNIMNQNLADRHDGDGGGSGAGDAAAGAEAERSRRCCRPIGAAQQNQTQNELNDAMSQYYEAYNEPYTRAAALSSILSSVPYGSTTTSYGTVAELGQQQEHGGHVAGGALSGASTGAMFGPYGAAVGAVAGGILGGLS